MLDSIYTRFYIIETCTDSPSRAKISIPDISIVLAVVVLFLNTNQTKLNTSRSSRLWNKFCKFHAQPDSQDANEKGIGRAHKLSLIPHGRKDTVVETTRMARMPRRDGAHRRLRELGCILLLWLRYFPLSLSVRATAPFPVLLGLLLYAAAPPRESASFRLSAYSYPMLVDR